MRFKEITKNKKYLVFIAVMAVQVLFVLYWGSRKVNYHIDELYSFGYASSYTGRGNTAQYITTSSDWKDGVWIPNATFKEYLSVSDEERLTALPLFDGLKLLLTKRNYFGLLNLVDSAAGEASQWPGILLNIPLLVLAEIMLIRLMRRLKTAQVVQYLALAMFGFSGYLISLTCYIRFYALVTLYLMLILNLLHVMWTDSRLSHFIPAEIGLLLCVYLMFKNTEFTMPFFAGICFALLIGFLIRKMWKQFACVMAAILCGVYYLTMRMGYITLLLHPERFDVSVGGTALGASENIAKASFGNIKYAFFWGKSLMEDYYFGNYIVPLVVLVAMTGLFIWRCKDSERAAEYMKVLSPATVFAMIAWAVVLKIAGQAGRGSRFCYLVLGVLFLYVVIRFIMNKKDSIRKIRISVETGYVLILVFTVAVYTSFIGMACLHTNIRYYFAAFMLITIILWYGIDRVLKRVNDAQTTKWCMVILTLMVTASALIPFGTRRIENVFEEERGFVQAVQERKDMNAILVLDYQEGEEVPRHEVYDLVNLLSDTSEVYIYNQAMTSKQSPTYPDSFLLWTGKETDVDALLKELDQKEYQVEALGGDHSSKVWMCAK